MGGKIYFLVFVLLATACSPREPVKMADGAGISLEDRIPALMEAANVHGFTIAVA